MDASITEADSGACIDDKASPQGGTQAPKGQEDTSLKAQELGKVQLQR